MLTEILRSVDQVQEESVTLILTGTLKYAVVASSHIRTTKICLLKLKHVFNPLKPKHV
jgi:hypothetical protein